MKNGLFHKRIPTLLALGILSIVIGVSTLLIRSGVFYVGKAAPEAVPQNVTVTNVSDTTFAVIFTTNSRATGVINMTDGAGASIVLDDRDKKTGASGNYFSHHITVPNLTPNTSYAFTILVNGKKFTDTNYRVTTGSALSTSPPVQNPLFGKVLLPTGENASDTLVIATTKEGQTVSDITSDQGAFIIPTNSLRTTNLDDYLILSDSTLFTIKALRETMKAEVTATFIISQNLPPITLLETYSFLKETDEIATSSSTLSIPQENIGEQVNIALANGQSFIDSQPLFTGTAYPNRTVGIAITGQQKTSVTTNSGGAWSYRPTQDLSQGEHTIVIDSTNDNGQKITDAATFFVFPSGSQVTETATPSATPTVIPTATPTLAPTISLTPSPTEVTPTSQPTLSPTPSPTVVIVTTTPTTTITPTALPPISNPGGSNNSLVLTGISIVLIIAGSILLFAL